jgi:hypothetical protein
MPGSQSRSDSELVCRIMGFAGLSDLHCQALCIFAIAADSSIGAAGTVPARAGQMATISECRAQTI